MAATLFGRADAKLRVRAHFERGDRLVTLVGPAGIGKTALAHAIAAECENAWFCELTEARDADALVAVVARTLDAPTERLGQVLAERGPLLLVCDNCEQVVEDAAAILARWLALAPETTILATSRERLRIEGETVYEVEPLGVDDAVSLFCERARRVGAVVDEDDDKRPAVRELVERLDGLPLAIELAAARANILSASELLKRLPGRLDLLAHGARGSAARQRTLRGAIDWSWELLDATEQAALRQCAVFAGSFALDAAEDVIHVAGAAVLDVLQRLRDKSLVCARPAEDGTTRLSLYESIREYAAEKLDASSDREGARARHAEHYLRVASELAGAVHARADGAALAKLAREIDNLLAAHRFALSRGEPDRALRAMLAIDPVLEKHGPPEVHLRLLDETLAATDAPPALAARVLVARARTRWFAGMMTKAREDLDRALELANGGVDLWARGRALDLSGVIDFHEGRRHEGMEKHRAAAAIFRDAGLTRWEGTALANLATQLHDLGLFEEALRCYEQALEILRGVGHPTAVGTVLYNIGLLEQELRRLSSARVRLEEALAILERSGDRRRHATALGFLAGVTAEEGDWDGAIALYERAADAMAAWGARHHEGVFVSAVGALHAMKGRRSDAERAFERARAGLESVGAPAMLAAYRVHAAHLAAPADAARMLDEARVSTSSDVRFAVRLLERALGAPRKRTLLVRNDARIVELDDVRIDLGRKHRLRRVLSALARARTATPGREATPEALVRAAWPGERIMTDAGKNRLRVAIALLRDAGLREVLLSAGDGYLLDPNVDVIES